MTQTDERPWLRDALEAADFGEGQRIFVLTADDNVVARAALETSGSSGMVVVVEPDSKVSDSLLGIDDDNLYVLTLEPDGGHRYGRFDLVFACPTRNPDWPLERWAAILADSLRPGGRFVLDLPGEAGCGELLSNAWQDAGGLAVDMATWSGPAEDNFAAALRDAGLRNVEGAVSTHLARFDTPLSLAEFASRGCASVIDPTFCQQLADAIVRRSTHLSDLEVVFRRTRLTGMR